MLFVCVERTLYLVGWIAVTIYALYQFAKINQSENHIYRLNAQDFRDGTLSNNLYDATDFEWQSFKKLYIDYWYIVLLHFALSNVLTVAQQPALKLTAWILITLYATYTVFSTGALIVVLINVVMLILLAVLGKPILSYALCFGVVLASQSTEIANRIFNSKDPRMTNEFDFEEKRFLFTYCICFLNARGLSSSLDNLTLRQKKELQSGKQQFFDKVITIAAYLLYLPGFFAGPIYLYNDFERATRLVKAEPAKQVFLGANYLKSMISLFLLIITVIYYEWLLHWLYSSAVTNDYTLIASYNLWEFSGFIVSLCILFYLKYCCIYGAFKVLATFDGVASISPPRPLCPMVIHSNALLWRKFDAGIYAWLKKYIYEPIAAQSPSLIRRFFATFVCFMCIALWHLPLTHALIMWISLNVLIAFIEIWNKALSQTQAWTRLQSKLSKANQLRLSALLSLPLYIMAILSNLYFLSGNELVPTAFCQKIFSNTGNYAIFLVLALYLGANVSIDYNRLDFDPMRHGLSFGMDCARSGKTQKKEATVKQSKKSN